MKRYITFLSTLTLAAITLSGCDDEEPAPPVTSERATTTVEESAAQGESSATVEAHNGDIEADPGLIHASEEEIAAAEEGVKRMMDIWVQGSRMNQQPWEKQLRSTLAPESVDISLSVWAHKVPDSRVENITVVRADSDSATFLVETDATAYHITSLRQPDNTWLVSDKRLATD